ncbi:MAG TPA: TonB-dependent receptor, partial [Candidatus Competibacter sp.]|nr:TonB-dependent receptor [Candidatus Competibacter sp.]
AGGGVVNIVTKPAREIGGVAGGAYGGSSETGGGWFQAGGRFGNFEAAFSLEANTTDGYRKTVLADDQTRIDQLLGTHASWAPGSINTQRDAI